MTELSYLQALLLGIVEGLTEFLPVSSTGHLILTSDLLGLSGEKIKAFEVCIQFGAILAVGLLYFKRLFGLLNLKQSAGFSGINGLLCIIAGCLPALFLGAIFSSKIKALLFSPLPVGIALVVGALLMFFAESFCKESSVDSIDSINPKQAFFVGLFQALSLWPGMSRAGASMVGGMFIGMNRKVSAEFSFLMAVPLITAATLHDIYESWNLLSAGDLKILIFGAIISFISALLAVRAFIALLGRITLRPFAWYRLVVGAIVIAYFCM